MKRPSPKLIAALACVFAAVLGISIWQLVIAGPGPVAADASQNTEDAALLERTADGSASSTTTITATDTPAAASTDGSSDTPTQDTSTSGTGTPGAPSSSGSSSPSAGTGSGGSQTTPSNSGSAPASNNPPPSEPAASTASQDITVSVSIDCITAVNAGNERALALTSDGLMVSTNVTLAPGATALDALKATGAAVGSTSSAMGVYVYSINSLAERDAGGQSGWVYYVNGTYAGSSSNKHTLAHGDFVQWRYTVTPGDLP